MHPCQISSRSIKGMNNVSTQNQPTFFNAIIHTEGKHHIKAFYAADNCLFKMSLKSITPQLRAPISRQYSLPPLFHCSPKDFRGPFLWNSLSGLVCESSPPSELVWWHLSLFPSPFISLQLPEMCRDHLWHTWNSLFPSVKLFPFHHLDVKNDSKANVPWVSRSRPQALLICSWGKGQTTSSNLIVYMYVYFWLYRCSYYWGLLAHL